jgi:Chromosome segregation ATPases
MAADDKTSPNETNPTNPTNPTYSVRTTKEISEKIQDLLAKTGLSSKDLFASMVEGFETKLFLETSPEQNQAMQQIRYHLARIDSVFLGMAQKVVDVTEDFKLRLDSQAIKHQEVTDRLTQEKFDLIKEATLAKESVDNIAETLERSDEQLSELTERAKADKLTISILTQKIDTLEKDVQSVPSLTKRIEDLREQIENMKQSNREANELNEALKRELATANRENVRLTEEAERKVNSMNHEHEQEIRYFKEVQDSTSLKHKQDIDRLNEVCELRLQHVTLQIEAEVSKAKQLGKEEQMSLMREHNQLIKDHAILREKYAALVSKKP